jgi:hypothetical protein
MYEGLEYAGYGENIGLADEGGGGFWSNIAGLSNEIVEVAGVVFEFKQYIAAGNTTAQALSYMIDKYGDAICNQLSSVITPEDCAAAKQIVADIKASEAAAATAIAVKTEQDIIEEQRAAEIEELQLVAQKLDGLNCNALTEEQKKIFSESLSQLEYKFNKLGMPEKFKELIAKFSCPLEKTDCSTDTIEVPSMKVGTTTVPATTTEVCNYDVKKSVLKTWGIPIAAGGAAGGAAFLITNKLIIALPAAIVTFGATKYLINKQGA